MSAIDVLYWHGKVHTFENPLSGRINYTSKLFHSYLKITIDMLNIYLKADQYRIASSLKSCYKTLGCIQKCISIISIFRPVNKSNLSVCLSVFLSFSVCLTVYLHTCTYTCAVKVWTVFILIYDTVLPHTCIIYIHLFVNAMRNVINF